MERSILCIDLKSFYASVECIERKLDPFKVPLVVANKLQGDGAITLAITPALKKLGVKSRGRLFEIPKNINYTIVPPRMSLYVKKSEEIVKIYLDFVAKEDLHVYSIDEAFLDVTNYLKYYNMPLEKLALKILKTITKKTGLTATCGIGPNMFLAKAALDNDAKYASNGIAMWNYDDVPNKLWPIKPLSNMWGIGYRMEKNLNNLGIHSVYDLAHYDKNKLKDLFGVIGEELWNHANGYDAAVISEGYNLKRSVCFSSSQILFKDYTKENIHLIFSETLDVLTSRLRKTNKVCKLIGLSIGYSKDCGGGFYHTIKMDASTDNKKELFRYINLLFDKYYEGLPIRKVGISLGGLHSKKAMQLNLFDDYMDVIKDDLTNKKIDEIKNKYGKNSILSASSLLDDSTIISRNKKIGGHSA